MCYLGMEDGVSIPALCAGFGGAGSHLEELAPCSARQSSMLDLSIIPQRLSNSPLANVPASPVGCFSAAQDRFKQKQGQR